MRRANSTLECCWKASTPARTRSYKVKNGDSLWQIARNNGVDVNDLKRWNGLDKHALKVGQTLKLQGGPQALAQRDGPSAMQAAASHVLSGAESLRRVAQAHPEKWEFDKRERYSWLNAQLNPLAGFYMRH